MRKNVYTMEDINKSLEKTRRKEERRRKFRNGATKAINWTRDNMDLVVIFLPIAVGAVGFATKTGVGAVKDANRARLLKKEENLKNLYCYDRSLGHYWALRRKLTNAEWVEIDKRKAQGERLADILNEMKVLK